uniref:hypothetical protein n=1 Tax=Catenella fusiformis TaxID=3024791 RepID=UPI0027D9CFF9|nr:hypothetical protein REQ04_pgp029 [Catenella fusiformis]WCH57598.1 hypothetical protein [Catenella fusiformis]
MNSLWQNIKKLPKFLFSVLIGFFLITAYQIFKLLKGIKNTTVIVIIISSTMLMLYYILSLMLGNN